MKNKQNVAHPFTVDPNPGLADTGIRGEPLGCPTGLNDPPEPPPGGPVDHDVDTTEVRGTLHVEKLEGRQESGRDAQDEAEEDEGE